MKKGKPAPRSVNASSSVLSTAQSRTLTAALNVPRTMRPHDVRAMTTLPVGRTVPIAVIPILREDAVRQGRLRLNFEMDETAQMLMNAVNVNVQAWFVPHLAFERFDGMDEFNRSYEGVTVEGGNNTTFIETSLFGAYGTNTYYKYLGVHGKPTDQVNNAYLEGYNSIFYKRARDRSPSIGTGGRGRLSSHLAVAFWRNSNVDMIVPDFDQALIRGEVALNNIEARAPVSGIGMRSSPSETDNDLLVRQVGGGGLEAFGGKIWRSNATTAHIQVQEDVNNVGYPAIYAELKDAGITLDLSSIEAAKKTAAYARYRQRYSGLDEDYAINLLMDGINVPDQAYREPMLLAEKNTIFGMSKRYATDSGNLKESVVEGMTMVDLSINTPALPTGGVIHIIAEILPEQLNERQEDPYFHAKDVQDFPQFMRDELDEEKVEVVKNRFIDTDHDTPDDTFGYAPLNFRWHRNAPNIGGDFYRPEVDASFDEDRQYFWAIEAQNPELTDEFYLSRTVHSKVFSDTVKDPFRVTCVGGFMIEGRTVFGAALVEATDDFEKIQQEAPTEQITKD